MDRTLTLEGYLGKDPEMRHTQERVITGTWTNRIALMEEPYEVRTRSRAYLVLSLATHNGTRTTWHRLVVWNGDALCHRNIRFAGKGDKVRVVGVPDSFTFTGADGKQRTLPQLIVQSFRLVERSARRRPPQIP